MKAILRESSLLQAAAYIAWQGYHPRMKFTRKGDSLEILGTDSYALVVGEVEADFEEWPDGVACGIMYGQEIHRNLMKLSRWASDSRIIIERNEDDIRISVDNLNDTHSYKYTNINTGAPDFSSLHKIEVEEPSDPYGAVRTDLLREATKMMRLVDRNAAWRPEPHGKGNVLFFRRIEDVYSKLNNVRVAVMPIREND